MKKERTKLLNWICQNDPYMNEKEFEDLYFFIENLDEKKLLKMLKQINDKRQAGRNYKSVRTGKVRNRNGKTISV
jgi:hypothetical protein